MTNLPQPSPLVFPGAPPAPTPFVVVRPVGPVWPGLRAGDADRHATCEALSDHYAAGRLSADELDRRLAAAVGATSVGELDRLLADLPPTPAAPTSQPTAPPVAPTPEPAAPRAPWRAADVLILLLVLGAVLVAGVLLLALGLSEPLLGVAALLGGTATAVVGAGVTHLVHRAVGARAR